MFVQTLGYNLLFQKFLEDLLPEYQISFHSFLFLRYNHLNLLIYLQLYLQLLKIICFLIYHKYKRIRYKGVICDRCGVEVTKAKVRRERMGASQKSTSAETSREARGVLEVLWTAKMVCLGEKGASFDERMPCHC